MMQPINSNIITTWIGLLERISSNQCVCPSFFKPFHLVTLGLAVKKAGFNTFTLPDGEFSQYAARMRLWESVGMDSDIRVNIKEHSGKFLPVHTFNKNQRDVQHVASELATIVSNTTTEEYQSALSVCLEELVNNFFDHANAKSDLPCLVCAQSWPNGKLVQLAIADVGIGIRSSLSENQNLISPLSTGNSCEISSQYGITSKPNNNHSGYGLTFAKDLMKSSGGTYILLSGNEFFSCNNQQEISGTIDSTWNGALLVLEWKIDAPLDSKIIYDNWPMPEGYSADDFF